MQPNKIEKHYVVHLVSKTRRLRFFAKVTHEALLKPELEMDWGIKTAVMYAHKMASWHTSMLPPTAIEVDGEVPIYGNFVFGINHTGEYNSTVNRIEVFGRDLGYMIQLKFTDSEARCFDWFMEQGRAVKYEDVPKEYRRGLKPLAKKCALKNEGIYWYVNGVLI